MPIDLAQVDWPYVAVLAIFVFVTTLIGGVLSFGHRWTAATLSALLFVGLFVFWTYYPHGMPLPKTITLPNAPTSTAAPATSPAVPAAPPTVPATPPTAPATPPSAPAAPPASPPR